MATRRPKSEHMVTLLDLTPIAETCEAFLKEKGKWQDGDEVNFMYTWGVVGHEGATYIICEEGVGSGKPLEEEEYELDVAITRAGWVMVGPAAVVHLRIENVAPLITSEQVPLHTFIRTFGNRLEVNFREWVRLLDSLEVR